MGKFGKIVEMTGGKRILLLHQIQNMKLPDFIGFIDCFAIQAGNQS